ncbi:unnamed protein product [Bursaphelenchus xylophilus]|uniref:(pine wood nematode) hypothetical protein n=1 Tax=Bursaphelenchus xylophilus TaxID=6326 RepID=A0A1I7RJ67_BURXY|nr:unnamed protein product [Bursaphelenchus xylophilus]CAG9119409.1 unnamed protein product [Bursaphelenchus xylophilus]
MSNNHLVLAILCIFFYFNNLQSHPVEENEKNFGAYTSNTTLLGLLKPEIEESHCRSLQLKHLITDVITKAPNSVAYIQKHLQSKLTSTFESQYGSYLVMVTRSSLYQSFAHGAEPGYNYCMYTLRNIERHPYWEIWVQVLKIDEHVL